MASLKSLAKDTAIYGISSIAARFINYLLVPIETFSWAASGGQYGIITNVYSYIGLLIIALTFGMETTFFRYANKEGENAQMVYSTALRMVGAVVILFTVVVLLFLKPITAAMGYAEHPWYIGTMAICVAIDAWSCILFDYLRYQHRPLKFAFLKVINIFINVCATAVFLIVFPMMKWNVFGIYDKNFIPDVGIVFYINLACSIATLLLLFKEMRGVWFGFDWALCKRMLSYTWPMLILGLAGQLNQSASTILFPYFYSGSIHEAHAQLGIYGSCIKIAMIMVIITQAFRFAYEPFVFANKSADKKQTYAKVMKYYVIFTLLAFLCVIGYMDILRHLVGSSYWEGLKVVPIVMAAEIMFGIYFNLSFWYKLTDRTIWGAYFSGLGCIVLILIDVIFIPKFSYMACAWAGFAAYGISMIASYVFGQKYYPINYPIKDILLYVVVSIILFVGMEISQSQLSTLPCLLVNTLLIMVYIAFVIKRDLPLSSLPVIGKHFKK
ncbi:MAG: lipopolysaccharide biosynthesis protein [Prevotella sp.]|jgi:O-antigen/teichoic acid export membrane protein|nr:lipopolysaccharide biosynthesis protein [Prevotella sp.]MCI2080504.1 lipopolysaccharide biosynthesis protein [Prevotella sp.]MCI2102327.1 lipopolysaccharide biosynthesis protein [Prevotella sp.]HCN53564.1 polysaccharide biosynthesis protein [Prevotella sp.]